ncbi:LysE family transporter [Paenibacillus cookii]|uniref:Amino acid transporter LysE n=1 Tax=Paenibacillus cookii TaxID=157839 RepID=A0ABQ4M3S6_9BACL|nr:LysE family transporter [Paenibacillus cookii]KHF31533.1 Cysteine/O-acetylserine efflux protein [Paenibacillus sp. P1XP2]GIO70189.1 amino acid transporter LysE [Paenibacillus cookii]
MLLSSMLLYAFISSFTPGPNNIMAMYLAQKHGFRKTFKFCLGVGTGFWAILLLCCYFDLWLKDVIPKIEYWMSIIGSVYMVYLALKIIRSKDENAVGEREGEQRFFTGMLLQFINPKVILFGLSVVSVFIVPYCRSTASLWLYSILLGCIGFAGTLSWSLFGAVFSRFLSKHSRPFRLLMFLLLIYCAYTILKY